MGALLGFFGAASMAPTAVARLQALLIAAMAMLAICLALALWAMVERSGRLSAEIEIATLKAQTDVLADALKRCSDGVENAAKAGIAAQADVKRLLGMAETAMLKTAALRDEARAIVAKAPPLRADGKPKDCGDAFVEIRSRVKP